MKAYLSHLSAMRYWIPDLAQGPLPQAKRSWDATLSDCAYRNMHLDALSIPPQLVVDGQLHLLVSKECGNPRSGQYVSHQCATVLPRGSFCELAPNVYVASPELCFVQMAPRLELVDAARLASYLCADFAIDTRMRDGIVERKRATTIESLERYIDAGKNLYGAAKAAKALRFALEGAASPMEIDLATRMVFPVRNGGYGLVRPEVNAEVGMKPEVKKILGVTHVYADVLWRDANIDMEYDSDSWHTGSSRITHDAQRRNAIQSSGVRVITVTSRQYATVSQMDGIAKDVAKALGKNTTTIDEKHRARRSELGNRLWDRSAILPSSACGASPDQLGEVAKREHQA